LGTVHFVLDSIMSC